MALNAIPGAKLFMNNELVLTRPNSIKANKGNAEIEVEAQVIGDGATDATHSPNYETAIGMVSFEVKSTDAHIKLVDSWAATPGELAVRLLIPGGSTLTGSGASLSNQIEINFSSDGYIEVEVKSTPLVRS